MILTLVHGFMFKTALNISRMCELNIYGPTTPHWVDRVRRRMPFKLNVGQNTDRMVKRAVASSSGFSSPYTTPWLESKYDKE